MRTTTSLFRILTISCTLAFSSCTSKIHYDTRADLDALRALKSQPVVILVAQYSDDVLTDTEPVNRSLAATLLEQQKIAFINQVGSMFSVTDASAEVVQRYGDKVDPVSFNLCMRPIEGSFFLARGGGGLYNRVYGFGFYRFPFPEASPN